jgi:hypothetical protein
VLIPGGQEYQNRIDWLFNHFPQELHDSLSCPHPPGPQLPDGIGSGMGIGIGMGMGMGCWGQGFVIQLLPGIHPFEGAP